MQRALLPAVSIAAAKLWLMILTVIFAFALQWI